MNADPTLALWNLVASPTIDPATFTRAIEAVLNEPNLDWRTRQLNKEGWEALEESAGPALLNDYLQEQTSIQIAEAIQASIAGPWNSQGDVKFPSLKERLVPHLGPITIRQFLENSEEMQRGFQSDPCLICGESSLNARRQPTLWGDEV